MSPAGELSVIRFPPTLSLDLDSVDETRVNPGKVAWETRDSFVLAGALPPVRPLLHSQIWEHASSACNRHTSIGSQHESAVGS